MRPRSTSGPIVVTGATGYIGGALLRALVERGIPARCLVRDLDRPDLPVAPGLEWVRGDVLDPSSLERLLAGASTAFYLVHSMASKDDFVERDREGARNFASAARTAGVRRIIYVGGLGDSKEALSPHLESRHEVGTILAAGGVQVVEFRASIVIGCGSFSFEMIRALVERLPVMVTPRWVSTPAQPIGISDLLEYLLRAIERPIEGNRIFEIGGAECTSYGGILREYARERGLRRLMIPVPVLTPRLSSLWLALVTPYYYAMGRKLVGSLRNPTLVQDDSAEEVFRVRPAGLCEVVAGALAAEDREFDRADWGALLAARGTSRHLGGWHRGTRIIDHREATSRASPAAAFAPIRRIGGRTGWYFGNALWRLRGLIDSFCGGVGLRRGRADPETPEAGSPLDFWRVESHEPDRRLRLRAEMKLPGRAWLEFEVVPEGAGSRVRQTAIFDAKGLLGLAYWYVLWPIHRIMFAGMLREIVRRGEAEGRLPSA